MNIINPYRFAAGTAIPEPLHWWDLNSLDKGTLDKGSGNWGRLTNKGAVVEITDHPDGVSDSLDFTDDGTSYLQTPTTNVWDGGGNDFTVSCWVKEDASTNGFMLSWVGAGGATPMFTLRINGEDPSFLIKDDAQTTTLTAIDAVADAAPVNSWYHVIGTYNSATYTAEVFLDGVSQASDTDAAFTALESSALKLAIGAAVGGSSNINAKMFQAAIWDTVLDADERAALFNSGNGGTYSDFFTGQVGTNPTTTDLFAWWKLENTDDADGNTYDLTNNNSVTFTTGYNDNAATYNGSNSLSVADDTNFPTGDQTWACYFKVDTLTGGAVILSKDDVSTNRSVLLYTNPTGELQFYASNNGTALSLVRGTGITIQTGVWYHACGVIDSAGTDLLLYIDGALINTETSGVSSVFNGTAACYVGGRSDGIEPTGQIDDACIFSKALSADEVRWLVHNTYADLT